MKIFFQLLRCFGEMITDLKFLYDLQYNNNRFDNYHRIKYYINEFCSKNLKNLESDLFGWESLEKPFINLEDLTILNRFYYLKEKLLSRLFPKLRRLRVSDLITEDNTCSVVFSHYFPNLHYLDLSYFFGRNYVDFGTLLRLNPQLRSLNVGIYDKHIEYLQFIESLEISISTSVSIPENSIYFNNVKRFKLESYSANDTIPKIPFLFRQLKEFEIKARALKYSDFFLTFLSENPMIEQLTLNNPSVFRLIKNGRLQQALPSLKYIFYTDFFETAEAIRIVSECLPYMGFLRFLSFSIDPATEGNFDEIIELCANEWRVCRTRRAIKYETNIFMDDITMERI